MLYRLLRVIAAIALRWYYAEIAVQGAGRAPRRGPLLLVANHPNALVDPLLVGTALPRRVMLTAGVVPLRRAKDEDPGRPGEVGVDRNALAFRSVTAALRRGGTVLIFPE